MAEPLSIIASIVGLVDVAAEISSQILHLAKEWKNAPAQIRSLSEEIDMSHHIAKELKALCELLEGQSQPPGYAEAISTQINRARPVWTELEKIVQSVQGPLKQKVRRDKWMVKAYRVAALQGQLREIRTSTRDILNIHTASRSMHIESLVATCNRNTVALYDISTTSFREIMSRLKVIETPQKSVAGDDTSLIQEQTLTLLAESEHPKATESWAYIKFGPKQRNCHRKHCYCRCHSKRVSRLRIAPFTSIAGSLFLVYSGFAFAGQHCDIPSCHNFGVCMIEVTYSLPQWTLNISVVGGLKIVHGYPTAGLTIQRRITKDMQSFSILDISRFGTAAELQVFLQKYPSSVHDIDAKNGMTALDYAIGSIDALGKRHYENANLLLAFGADPFVVDDYGRSAALVEMITLSAQKCTLPFMQDRLPSTADFDNYDLSHLTKIILGFRPLNLPTELSKVEYRHLINYKDETGLTPLHWAVRMGDSSAVQQLLKAGADPEILDPWNTTPLSRACMRLSSASCVEALAMAGADFSSRGHHGYLPIHTAAGAGQSDKILSICMARGLNIQDSSTLYRSTPLALAALSNRADTCKFLLAQGAQIDSVDWEGDTPLNEAIRSRSHRVLTVLLSAGANYLHKDDHGCTVLHEIATTGDNTTIAIISEVCLTGLDPEAKDSLGRTAHDYLQMRVNIPDGFREALDQLMERIRYANSRPLEKFESDDEDDFFDALESLNFDHGIAPEMGGMRS